MDIYGHLWTEQLKLSRRKHGFYSRWGHHVTFSRHGIVETAVVRYAHPMMQRSIAEVREPSGGRPKDPEKRAAILCAARDRFFARGLDATSIEEIAAAAGVSKVTVYGHFGDKETLMEAVIRAEASRMEATLLRPRPPGATIADRLNDFGVTLLGFLAEPAMEACDRILSAAAERHPGLARRFFEAGPGYVHAQLSRTLTDAAVRGEIAVDDPALAAEDLVGLWKGMWMIERRFGIHRARTAAEVSARVARGTTLFLRAYRL